MHDLPYLPWCISAPITLMHPSQEHSNTKNGAGLQNNKSNILTCFKT